MTEEPKTKDNAEDNREVAAHEAAGAAKPAEGLEAAASKQGMLEPVKKWWRWLARHKRVSGPAGAVLIVGLLMVVPQSRYALAGLIVKQDFKVAVADSQTGKPISSATVALGGQSATTDNKGQAVLHTKVGRASLTVSKKYYADSTAPVMVPIGRQKQGPWRVTLKATGRQVPVTVMDKVSHSALADVTLKAAGTEAKTGKDGKVTLVLPADKKTVDATVSAKGYNDLKATVQVTDQEVAGNAFQLTSSGKLYFLSNLHGTIDVVKTNLDGTDRQTVLAGTGKEDKQQTVLLASRDWKYLALLSKRDGGDKPKLFLIDTDTDKLTTIDEGNADFTLVGWSDHYFVYNVERSDLQATETGHTKIKSFNAATKQMATLDQTQAKPGSNGYGTIFQDFTTNYLVDDHVVYAVQWRTWDGGYAGDGRDAIRTVDVDGQNKKDLNAIEPWLVGYINVTPYEPKGLYFRFNYNDGGGSLWEYDDDTVKAIDLKTEGTNESYPTYLSSPSGKHAFWSETRDGKNTLFVGDDEGKDGKQIASLSEYQIYGWYTDNYLLVSKNASELYILPAQGLSPNTQPLKITDYYKPALSYPGYGGGYGGF